VPTASRTNAAQLGLNVSRRKPTAAPGWLFLWKLFVPWKSSTPCGQCRPVSGYRRGRRPFRMQAGRPTAPGAGRGSAPVPAGRVRTVPAALAWKFRITWKLFGLTACFISTRRKVSTLTAAQARTAALHRSHRSWQHHAPHGFHATAPMAGAVTLPRDGSAITAAITAARGWDGGRLPVAARLTAMCPDLRHFTDFGVA
jgi:hypothetical protein